MDLKQLMVFVKGADQTGDIAQIESGMDHRVLITFQGGKTYGYEEKNVRILRNPKVVELSGCVAYLGNIPVYEPQLVLDFGSHFRIFKHNGEPITVGCHQFSVVKNCASGQAAHMTLAYLREISQYTFEKSGEEAFLYQQIKELTFVHPESVLGQYLNRESIKRRTPDTSGLIFPFRFNLSQKAALENALTHSISVIEGPPGTGKTQTILNLCANLVAIEGKRVAVVSNNNEAVKNVLEKMDKHGYGFLIALLGRKQNQEHFFAHMPVAQLDGWDTAEPKTELIQQVEALGRKLNRLLEVKRTREKLSQELRDWTLEQAHFEEYFLRQDLERMGKLPLQRASAQRILSFLAETSLAKDLGQSKAFLHRLKLFFKYGVLDYQKLEQKDQTVLLSLQREFYKRQIRHFEGERSALEAVLDGASFDALLEEHWKCSEKLFQKCLFQSHSSLKNPDFTKKNYRARFKEFVATFPIIVSTTYALRQSIPQNYLLDYVIIDEASQVDLLTGVLAFSCCRNVVIVGDRKQLSHITDKKIKTQLKTAPPDSALDYFEHSVLSSVLSLYGSSLPREILREHYRCHPQIIEFCNQKYYGGQLIPYTEKVPGDCPLVLYKTSAGNHMRRVTRGEKTGNYNQREIDVFVEEILKNPDLVESHDTIGFVTPYRKQADKGHEQLPQGIQSDTVHRYQGREKDVMILSTVLDNTGEGQRGLDFVDDPQMINVAVSRAVKRFVLVTDSSLFFKRGREIGDLIRYIQYQTLEKSVLESRVVSVFDLLYQQYSKVLSPIKAKMNRGEQNQSEEALRVLLEELLSEPQNNRYGFVREVLLRNLLNTVDLLSDEELRFVKNRASLDFVVFGRQDKACVLAIEVDGFAFHENNPEQLRRDRRKDEILKKYGIPLLRLETNGSREREKIQSALNGIG